MKLLYLSGHGLSPRVAFSLANCPADNETKKSAVWPWDLRRCQETMGRTPLEITSGARAGDIVVFSSGLLTPEWVIDRIRDSESFARNNTVIIVIDACFSGNWRSRIIAELQNPSKCKLQYARVLVQTSCGNMEVSYGDLFTPLFCWLQSNGETVIPAMQNSHLFKQQSPTFYDSASAQPSDQPVVRHNCGDKNFYFFNCPKTFHNAVTLMCERRNTKLKRGIPDNEITNFFESIYDNSQEKPNIVSCKLKTMSNSTPLALFLMEWKNKFYHLHIHFYAFNNMRISGVTHVDVTKQSDIFRPQFTETGEKKYIASTQDTFGVWNLITSQQFADYCKSFVRGQNLIWERRSSWQMTDSMPRGMIRSRCASLQIKLLTSLLPA